ncbi:MAG: class I mannose-6-phosphate isomerase [Fusobacteriaceae bacterium]|jgi:mannose-6-phosphate isomerase|nr:class I mannose-6-phosphate isomerase [Fusobacteriaceae bacterium]
MSIVKLKPAFKNYLWGGAKLKTLYGKENPDAIIAESWELSCHPAGESLIATGDAAGLTLSAYIARRGKRILGENCRRFAAFPILVKLIDAARPLSVQVHPGNDWALAHEGEQGKTEMWVVLECEPGAFLYYGFTREISREELAQRIAGGRLEEVLNRVPVQSGDVFFISPGTIHAIGEGIVIAEIQQSSDVTYRVYDYGRVDQQGRPRELHIEKALAVLTRTPPGEHPDFEGHLGKCPYFEVDRFTMDGERKDAVDDSSFQAFLFYKGEGVIRQEGTTLRFRKGDCFFAEAGSGSYRLEGTGEFLRIRVPR